MKSWSLAFIIHVKETFLQLFPQIQDGFRFLLKWMIGNILSLFIGLPYYCTICTYILTNFLPVRLNCLKIRTDQLQFSMNSALTIRMLLLLKSIWCISSIFCSVYLNYTIEWNTFKCFLKFKKLLFSGWSCRWSYGWHHGYWWTQVKYSKWKIEKNSSPCWTF